MAETTEPAANVAALKAQETIRRLGDLAADLCRANAGLGLLVTELLAGQPDGPNDPYIPDRLLALNLDLGCALRAMAADECQMELGLQVVCARGVIQVGRALDGITAHIYPDATPVHAVLRWAREYEPEYFRGEVCADYGLDPDTLEPSQPIRVGGRGQGGTDAAGQGGPAAHPSACGPRTG